MIRALLAAIAIVSLQAAIAAGCGSTAGEVCTAKCACEGCTEAKRAECLQEHEADLRAAQHRGCPATYDAFLDCQNATGTCVGNDWETSCKPEKEAFKACVDPK